MTMRNILYCDMAEICFTYLRPTCHHARIHRTTGVSLDAFKRSLDDCLRRKGVKADEKILHCGICLIKAFSHQPVKNYAVDFGTAYRAVSIYVELEEGRAFLVRSEADSREEIVGFSIFRNGKQIYSGTDVLSEFGKNIDRLFKYRNRENDYEYVSEATTTESRIPQAVGF